MKKVTFAIAVVLGVVLVITLMRANNAAATDGTQPAYSVVQIEEGTPSYLPFLSKPLPTATPTQTPTPLPLPGTLSPVADTMVLQGRSGNNYGFGTRMLAGYDVMGCQYPPVAPYEVSRSLVKFNTSPIPPGTQIVQATLHINKVAMCWSTSITGQTRTVTAHRVSSGWSEASVTWNSQPTFAEAYGSTTILLDFNSPDWYSLDITNLVRGWVNGSLSNEGLALRGPENSGGGVAVFGFATQDWPDTSRNPYLSITYGNSTSSYTPPNQSTITSPLVCEQLESGFTVCQLDPIASED